MSFSGTVGRGQSTGVGWMASMISECWTVLLQVSECVCVYYGWVWCAVVDMYVKQNENEDAVAETLY